MTDKPVKCPVTAKTTKDLSANRGKTNWKGTQVREYSFHWTWHRGWYDGKSTSKGQNEKTVTNHGHPEMSGARWSLRPNMILSWYSFRLKQPERVVKADYVSCTSLKHLDKWAQNHSQIFIFCDFLVLLWVNLYEAQSLITNNRTWRAYILCFVRVQSKVSHTNRDNVIRQTNCMLTRICPWNAKQKARTWISKNSLSCRDTFVVISAQDIVCTPRQRNFCRHTYLGTLQSRYIWDPISAVPAVTKHARNFSRNTLCYQILWILRLIRNQSQMLWDKWPEFWFNWRCHDIYVSLKHGTNFDSIVAHNWGRTSTARDELLFALLYRVAGWSLFSRVVAIHEPNATLMFLRARGSESGTQCAACECRGFGITYCKLFTISIICDTYWFHKFSQLVFRFQHASMLNTFLHRSCWWNWISLCFKNCFKGMRDTTVFLSLYVPWNITKHNQTNYGPKNRHSAT